MYKTFSETSGMERVLITFGRLRGERKAEAAAGPLKATVDACGQLLLPANYVPRAVSVQMRVASIHY